MSERFKAKKHELFDRWYVSDIRAQGLPLYDEAEAREHAAALNAADARGELDAPKQQPDWEGLCRSLVSEIHKNGRFAAIHLVIDSPAAKAARDAVRASELPDERVGDFGRFYAASCGAFERGTYRRLIRVTGYGQQSFPESVDEHIVAFLNDNYDRRSHTGTRADRREGGA